MDADGHGFLRMKPGFTGMTEQTNGGPEYQPALRRWQMSRVAAMGQCDRSRPVGQRCAAELPGDATAIQAKATLRTGIEKCPGER